MPGIAGDAFRDETARAFRRLARTKPITVGAVAKLICVSPARSDCVAGPPPLNCTCVNWMPATDSNSTDARCGDEPYPADAWKSFPGLALAYAIISPSALNGALVCTHITVGPVAMRPIGAKSLPG